MVPAPPAVVDPRSCQGRAHLSRGGRRGVAVSRGAVTLRWGAGWSGGTGAWGPWSAARSVLCWAAGPSPGEAPGHAARFWASTTW